MNRSHIPAGHWLALALTTTVICGANGTATAAELLMFEQAACPFCAAFNREIAPDYPQSKAGVLAPLRHVDIHESRTGGVGGLDPAIFTPTFVLVDHGKEVGRMMGYPGRRYFYPEIQGLLDKLPQAAN
jgi:hypothetical protein